MTQSGTVVVTDAGSGRYTQRVTAGEHEFLADEPVIVGGDDAGPNPYDLLLSALGTCTAMTLRMYADRKGIPLTRTIVRLRHDRIHARDCERCETEVGLISRITREITLEGILDDEQRARLLEIADKCPVHRTLTHEIAIETREV
ncbi:OsmC family protein [Amycolatopsis jejuensis]|uniref:OsmC family protein n=1 Tax=Amycolatopsis jejuensis TaxID=330084 RepID=UPI0005265F6E|nr:OsmC family protein [Amycolatopsis jejuensis]